MSIAKYSAIATNAISPPERRLRFVSALPGGCTFISIPQLSTSFSSSSLSAALPPPKSSRKVWRKHSSISLKRSTKTSSIWLVISLMMPTSSLFAFVTSSRCPLRKP